MLDWIGSVAIRKRTPRRIELDLTRATTVSGLGLAAVGVWLVLPAVVWSTLIGGLLIATGALLATLRRRLIFDRDDGLLHIEQRVLGIRRRAAIPLFHLRAIVVSPRRRRLYVAYVERRVGGAIYLDEATGPKPLLELADAIAEVADLHVIHNTTASE